MTATIKRKNIYLDQAKLKRAQRILSAKTETEAIDKALDLVTFQKDILSSLKKVKKGKSHISLV